MTDRVIGEPAVTAAMRPRAHGLGIAVVFDWALTAQLTTQALASATRSLGFTPNPLMIAGALVAGAGLFALGEGLRRGVAALELVQVGLMVLITLIGIGSLVPLVIGTRRRQPGVHDGHRALLSPIRDLEPAQTRHGCLVRAADGAAPQPHDVRVAMG